MKTKDTKEMLVSDYLADKRDDTKKSDSLIRRLEKYLSGEADPELILILQVLRTLRADIDQKEFSECCAVAAPIFEQLENTTTWGYIEFNALSSVIGYHINYEKTLELFQEALDVLEDEEYMNNPKFNAICTTLHFNITLRLLRVKYFDHDVDTVKLEDLFTRSYKHVMGVSVRKGLPHQHIPQVRRGIFENNIELINSGLYRLDELNEKKRYRTTRDEIAEYLSHMDGDLSKPLLNFLVGHQLRKLRNLRNMTPLELGHAIDVDQNAITAIERGDDGVSVQRLYKLANVLGTDMRYFFGDEDKKAEDVDPFMLTVKAYMSGTTEADKTLILKVIKTLMEDRYPDLGKKSRKKSPTRL